MTKAKESNSKSTSASAELPDAALDKVSGGGNQPTATKEATGTIKSL